MNQPNDNSGIEQQLENSQVHGGIQATQGEKNVQVHGEGNILTFNQTEILKITEREITSRELIKTSPYKGLEAFKSRDKELFFGRDNFITTLVNELEQTNLILLLGASGSGKSSVVKAGLIPWLERTHGNEFINLNFTPDADPFVSFHAKLLGNYSQKEAEIAREINSETLVKVANNLKQADEFWFIFIDQFEELFTTSDQNKRREFINGLMKLSQAKLSNLKIMATIRADFFERLSEFPQLVEATQKHRPMIVEMQSNELRLAIEQPAAHHGIIFEAGLVDKIISEVQGQAGCLPLLQYTLNLIWQDEVKTGSIHDRVLNLSTYEKLGGVRGALQQHVDSIYKNFSPSEKQATQRIFLKLVGIGENAESGIEWKPVRRRAMLSEFRDDERDVLLKLVNDNLLVSNADLSKTDSKKGFFGFPKSVKSNSTVEIAHEILLTCWDKLKNWIEKNRQGIAIRNRLYEDVKRWQDRKPEDELWSGSKLEQVLELRNDDNFNQVLGGFNTIANQFIDASVGLDDRQLRRTIIIAKFSFTLAALAQEQRQKALDTYINVLKNLLPDDVVSEKSVIGEIKVLDNDNNWKILSEPKGKIFSMLRDYGEGKVIAVGHDSILDDDVRMSNLFVLSVFGFLNLSRDDRKVLISSGHCEITFLTTREHQYAKPFGLKNYLTEQGYTVEDISAPIDETKLREGNILVIGNAWGNFTQSEIYAVEKFVKNGGSLFVSGLGWSWRGYSNKTKACQKEGQNTKDISTYPMNRLVKPYNMQWTERPVFHR